MLVLPEDDANRALANGFALHESLDARAFRIQPCAGGWSKVRDVFSSDHISAMRRKQYRHIVLLVDFDSSEERLAQMSERIPDDVRERVFVIGVWTEPEDLPRSELGTKEEVGLKLAEDCVSDTREVWSHRLLRHNDGSLKGSRP